MSVSPASAGRVGVLDTTVSGGSSSREAAYAASLGHTVDIIPAAIWQTMSVSDFAVYDALILGDPTCKTGTSWVAAAENNPDWALAVDGNVVVIGSDPTYHYSSVAGAEMLVKRGLDFALAEAGSGSTGAYVTLSCYYHYAAASTYVDFLSSFGDFYVTGGATTGALNDIQIVASHPALTGLTSAMLSYWWNTAHESFGLLPSSWPADFEVLAIAKHASGNFVAPDGTRGYPFILARGVIPDKCGDGVLDPTEECDDGNNADGDGCDLSCNLEDVCPDADGDGYCDAYDQCTGNDASGDSDSDGVCDDIDDCPLDPYNDSDGDGVCGDVDNCPLAFNSDQADNDGDGLGDVCDDDDDNDGIGDGGDNCQYVYNPGQSDWDADGQGDACDADDDGDGVNDSVDACFPTDLGATVDATGCSLAQLCPCDADWKNHGAYVRCNAHESERFVEEGLMTEEEKDAHMSLVGQSTCGHKK